MHVLDTRSSGGQFALLGGALTLPTSANTASSPSNGSLRWNTSTNIVELYYDGSWTALVNTSAITLGDLSGVTLTDVSDTQVLTYSQSAGAWINESPPYDVYGTFIGSPGTSQMLWRIVIARSVTFPIHLTGSVAACATAATSSVALSITHNGSSIGSINYAASATTGTFTFASQVVMSAGDILEVDGPGSTDATFATPSWAFVGSR